MAADNYFINNQNSVYYLIFTLEDWVDVFTRKEAVANNYILFLLQIKTAANT